jgi:hypothetical protein
MYRFMLAEKAHFEVRAMCRVLGIAPSSYYAWEGEQQCEHAVRDEQLLLAVHRIFAKFLGRYVSGVTQAEGRATGRAHVC